MACFLHIAFNSCSENILDDSEALNKVSRIRMSAVDFHDTDEKTTRSILTPTSSGTSFSWMENDVVAVYSSSKGMTNFLIDNNNISEDGLSAEFDGSGFMLTPNSKYYAFYPYSKASTDKTTIPISYLGQRISSNGDFRSLGNYDYMFACGVADDNSHSSFLFNHLGCVIEFIIKVPATAKYTSVRFELDHPTSNNYLIRSGKVDITAQSPSIIPDTYVTDSVFKVNLGDNGIYVEKESLLTVYMICPPQNLEGKDINVRLVDSETKWYKAIVAGKNMRAGYTYHYSINTSGEGFSGTGQGFPNDELNPEYVSTYTHPNSSPYEWLLYDNHVLYATGSFGLRKISYEKDSSPNLISESSIDLGTSQKGRAMVMNDDLIYVGVRQNTGGDTELYKPQLSFTFDTNLKTIDTESAISNSDLLNSFIKKLRLKSFNQNEINEVLIYKAQYDGGIYKNVIQLRKNGVSLGNLYRETYNTKEDALKSLPSSYTNSKGDYVELDWAILSNSFNYIKDVVFNTYGEFDNCEIIGSASFDEMEHGSPNKGGFSGRFKTTKSGDNQVKVSVNKNTTGGDLSFMMKLNYLPNEDVKIPLLSNNGNDCISIVLQPGGDGVSFALVVGDNKYSSTTVYKINEWYNVKVSISSQSASLWIREKECGSWILLTTSQITQNTSFDAVCMGVISHANNVELLVDDYYYNETDIDKVSYVNGALAIVNKHTLDVINIYNFDYKVCGLATIKNRLILNFLNGFNVYDIENPLHPTLIYTYRPSSWTEYQGVDCFECYGRIYALSCTYTKGFSIVDLTDANNVSIINQFNFNNIIGSNSILQGNCYSFDIIVDYPYAFATIAPVHDMVGTSNDHRGVVSINLSDLNNPSMYFSEIPHEYSPSTKSGDITPTRIDKCGNRLFVNSSNSRVEVFDIGNNGTLSYNNGIITPHGSSPNAVMTTTEGYLFVGMNGSLRNVYLYKGLR